MNYDEKMEELIVTDEMWPWFNRPDLFHQMQGLAEVAYSRGTIEGYLSSVLIYQQLVEEMTWVLLKDCQFLMKLGLWGTAEIDFPELRGAMFGRLLDELKKAIAFDEKDEFIAECNKLNAIRIQLVHGLVKHEIESPISAQAERARNHFAKLTHIFTASHQQFMRQFESEKNELISTKQFEQWYD